MYVRPISIVLSPLSLRKKVQQHTQPVKSVCMSPVLFNILFLFLFRSWSEAHCMFLLSRSLSAIFPPTLTLRPVPDSALLLSSPLSCLFKILGICPILFFFPFFFSLLSLHDLDSSSSLPSSLPSFISLLILHVKTRSDTHTLFYCQQHTLPPLQLYDKSSTTTSHLLKQKQ